MLNMENVDKLILEFVGLLSDYRINLVIYAQTNDKVFRKDALLDADRSEDLVIKFFRDHLCNLK